MIGCVELQTGCRDTDTGNTEVSEARRGSDFRRILSAVPARQVTGEVD